MGVITDKCEGCQLSFRYIVSYQHHTMDLIDIVQNDIISDLPGATALPQEHFLLDLIQGSSAINALTQRDA